jgi:hypothetical protein
MRMTNHPRRQRGEENDDLSAAEALAGELVPAGPGDIPPQGSAEVPAHTGNGVPPGLRANAAKLIGQAVAEAMTGALPQVLFQAFGAALSQVQVQTVTQQHLCHLCLVERFGWESAHETEIKAAMKSAAEAAGFGPEDPRAQQLDFGPFLPEQLRPGAGASAIPAMNTAVTTVQGSDVCQWHVPGVQARRGKLLVVPGGVNLAAFAAQAGAISASRA